MRNHASFRWQPWHQQNPRFYAQRARQSFEDVKTNGVPLALDRTDVCPIDRGQICKSFLRKTTLDAERLEIFRQDIPQDHSAVLEPLSTFSPRSILYADYVGQRRMGELMSTADASFWPSITARFTANTTTSTARTHFRFAGGQAR